MTALCCKGGRGGHTRRFQPLLPDCVGRVGGYDVESGSRLARECVGKRRCIGKLARHLGRRNLLTDIVVQHEVVGVDIRRRRCIGRVDVDTAARKGQKAPVLDSDGPSRCGRNNDFGNGNLVLEDEVVLDAEKLLGHGAVDDAAGVGGPVGVLLESACDACVESSKIGFENVVHVEVGCITGESSEVGAVVVDVEHVGGGLVLQVLANEWKVDDDVNVVLLENAIVIVSLYMSVSVSI